MLNVDTRHLLTPDDYWPQKSKLEAKYLSRLNISVQLGPQRNFQTSSLARMKSLHTLAPIQSPYDSHTTSEQYTRYSTSQCWNQHSRIQSQIGFNPTPLPLIIEDQPEFEISDILDTKIDNRHRCKIQYLV